MDFLTVNLWLLMVALKTFYFPNEFVMDLNKLESGLPSHQVFYSSLHQSKITKEEHKLVQKNMDGKRLDQFKSCVNLL